MRITVDYAGSAECVKFQIGDVVQLRLDSDVKGVVVGILFREFGVMYEVSYPDGVEMVDRNVLEHGSAEAWQN